MDSTLFGVRFVLTHAMQIGFVQVLSHQKAAAATASGRFKDEIVPVATKVKYRNVI